MATTTVKKGAGRPAAAARTNKHAQRTALPPRPGVVEEARRPVAVVDGERPDDRSVGKARAFADKAVALGWQAEKAIVGGAAEVTVTRGPETIVQAWRNGVWDYTVSFYAYGDRNTKPRNASGAAKLLTRTPDEANAEASKVASNRHFRKAEPKDITTRLADARRALPFDPDLATDEEVCATLAGRAVVWYNRLSRGQESAIVGRSGVRLTMLPDGQRVANFCCPATGYRSCLVSAILKVGRGRNATTKGSESASVEVE
jgi:hypothetical protein